MHERTEVPLPPGVAPVPDPMEIPFDAFVQDARGHLERILESGRPAALTADGHARAVVLSAELYEALLEAWDEAAMGAGLLRGLLDDERENLVPLDQAFEELERDLKGRRER